MIRSLNLEQLGRRIDAIDKLVCILIAHRMELSLNVGAFKQACNPPIPIHNGDREHDRLDVVQNHARELGIDSDFMRSMLYNVIGESCKQQMIQLQKGEELPPDVDDDDWYQFLRSNLLSLTRKVAPSYDKEYSSKFFASNSYEQFEFEMLKKCIEFENKSGSIAVDLGCATGNLTSKLQIYFENVVGYDISPEMLSIARKKEKGISFEKLDLEDGAIPLSNNSVSFVVMNLGTGSDIREIEKVIHEVDRILKPGGKFLFSFYNSNALVYHWDFLPWPLTLAAELNRAKDCLDVHIGKKIYSIYARAYSTDEVKAFFLGLNLRIENLVTFPTVSSILPEYLFANESARQAIWSVDTQLSDSGFGAYIIATGVKGCLTTN